MMDLNLSRQYAIIALDGQDCIHSSIAKNAVIRGIAAAKILEEALDTQGEHELSEFTSKLDAAVESAKGINKKEKKQIESEMSDALEAAGLLIEGPDILGCDVNYYTAGIELKAYRSEANAYLRTAEGLRAEVLEDGIISIDCAVLLWLLRETGCIHDLFSVSEQNRLQERMTEASAGDELYRILWQAEFHNSFERLAGNFLKGKDNLFKNPYLEGVNLIFPYLERRKAIFIDFVVLKTSVKERRTAVEDFLIKMGHHVEEIKLGNETLLKVENVYYRIFPMAKRVYGVPVQGGYLVPVYW